MTFAEIGVMMRTYAGAIALCYRRKGMYGNNQRPDVARVCDFLCENRAFSRPYQAQRRYSPPRAKLLRNCQNRVLATLATRNLTTLLAGILIFCCVLGLKPVRAFLFCFSSLPKPGRTNSPFFLVSLYARELRLRQVRFEVLILSCLAVPYGSGSDRFQGKTPLLVGLIWAHKQRP